MRPALCSLRLPVTWPPAGDRALRPHRFRPSPRLVRRRVPPPHLTSCMCGHENMVQGPLRCRGSHTARHCGMERRPAIQRKKGREPSSGVPRPRRPTRRGVRCITASFVRRLLGSFRGSRCCCPSLVGLFAPGGKPLLQAGQHSSGSKQIGTFSAPPLTPHADPPLTPHAGRAIPHCPC